MDDKTLRRLMKIKIVRASNTNGLKQKILDIISQDCRQRKFNSYEAINALNAVKRTRFFVKDKILKPAFKYKAVRMIYKDVTTFHTKITAERWELECNPETGNLILFI